MDRARRTGASLVRLRKTVVFDRLLARLNEVALERWILKGALALDFRSAIASSTRMRNGEKSLCALPVAQLAVLITDAEENLVPLIGVNRLSRFV